jgi:hypothetical protein
VASPPSEFVSLAQELFELSGVFGHDRIMTHPSGTLPHTGPGQNRTRLEGV